VGLVVLASILVAAAADRTGNMSFDGDCEPCEVWRETKRRARKEHKCSACKETIERTHFYIEHFSLFDGDIDTLKRCIRCETIYQHLRDISDVDSPPMPRLDCGHKYRDCHSNPCPPEIEALAFALPKDFQ
jgi:hypothetical protein